MEFPDRWPDRSPYPGVTPVSLRVSAEAEHVMPPDIPIVTMTVFNGILSSKSRPTRIASPMEIDVPEANYTIVAQSADEVDLIDNSPSISMWPHLLNTATTQRLNEISIYADKGTTREQLRLLYMNRMALQTWREMGRTVTVVGEAHRPPRTATLTFGMPFSE